MATPAALQSLQDTHKALQAIREKLQPLLDTLRKGQPKEDVATARAGILLTLGTLRFLAHRLRGTAATQGDGPALRQELNRMRRLLVQVQKKVADEHSATPRKRAAFEKDNDDKDDNDDKKETASSPSTATPAAKRQRIR